MKHVKIKIIFAFLFSSCVAIYGQTNGDGKIPFQIPAVVIKSNVLYDLSSTINLGVEFKLNPRFTLDASVNYNPWTFSEGKKFKHLLVQPELRYWFCESFNGHFMGLHGIYSRYNVTGINFPFIDKQKMEENRYQGDMFGAGLSYGYQWYLSPRWNLEATLGVGYARLRYNTYPCSGCGQRLDREHKNYVGPTKIGLSLIYVIN